MNEHVEVAPEGGEVEAAVGVDGPGPAPTDPPQPKSWQVGYADLGTFAMIGTSQKSVAAAVMHLREKFRLYHPDTLVPINVLDLRGREEISWIFPALITGVFNETPDLQRQDEPHGSYPEALDALMGRNGIPEGISVVVVEPANDNEENEDGN